MIDPARLQLNTLPPPVHIESLLYQTPVRRTGPGHPGANTASALIAPGVPKLTAALLGSTSPEVTRPHDGSGSRDIERHIEDPFSATILLPPGSRRIQIRYTAPSFVAPEKVRFQVKLDGRDTDWQDQGNQRVADFYELPPRPYVFRVRAANNDGVWNETGASLAFTVEPFIWQTMWFRLGAITCLFGAGVATAGWRLHSRHRRELESVQRSRRQQGELAHVARVSTMGELASSMAHELNQPLAAILSNAEAAELFLSQSPPALAELRDILADIRKDDERAGEVIRRMRNLLRKREMEMTLVDLNLVVKDVLRLVGGDASLRHVAIDVDLSPRAPQIQGDSIHLQQVFLNLIINAMEAVAKQPPQKRRLNVATQQSQDAVQVAVSDSGCGIEPANLPHLFEPFYTTKPNGMGMGLSIAKRIIEAHHGRMSAENNPDGGATFRVILPASHSTDGSLK
jgi:signal transduction histidine kinase